MPHLEIGWNDSPTASHGSLLNRVWSLVSEILFSQPLSFQASLARVQFRPILSHCGGDVIGKWPLNVCAASIAIIQDVGEFAVRMIAELDNRRGV